jgi:hypothetical protein
MYFFGLISLILVKNIYEIVTHISDFVAYLSVKFVRLCQNDTKFETCIMGDCAFCFEGNLHP